MEGKKEWKPEECRKLIEQIDDVISSNIVTSEDGLIEQVHVLARDRRSPKQIVRDIESLVHAEYNLKLDYKKVSVVRVDNGFNSIVPKRLKFCGISFNQNGQKAKVKVCLSHNSEIFEGYTEGPYTKSNYIRLVAEATLKAVQLLLKDKVIFTPEEVMSFNINQHKIMMVSLSMINQNFDEESLVGCAFIKGDDKDAVVRATLNALNRKV
ncbi:hypothetical protein [Candidatus Contubernalis alkaliaceticus]|uniref:hypothetical protein n=1 Tax=Candidatus Contubernalis alkaliaceticus TaxID=338645 RepID=UPI001F4C126D|nr:hypothetical protein [Candidatus Contubernalis alkalaceticus]UNC90768.1 hypothetical protein HUE98_00905 [Candidatus Contubernalis alkalaceticus]